MKILVTGGAGFIGSHTAEHFATDQNRVTVLDNLSRAKLLGKIDNDSNNWKYLEGSDRDVELINGDVRSVQDAKGAAKDSQLIIHTAAQVAVTASLKDPKTDFEVNALGTLNMLEEARRNDSAFIFCSTNKVYGENVNAIPLRELSTRYEYAHPEFREGVSEDLPVDHTTHTPYGCSKLAADLYVQDYGKTYGLRTGVFRLSCIYGTRQYGVEDQGWLAWFVRATLKNLPISIYGNGKQVRDILWIDDLVDAFDAFATKASGPEVFNLGGGPKNTVSLLELLHQLEDLTGNHPKTTFLPWRKGDQKTYVSNIKNAHDKLGWTPTTDVILGVRKLVKWAASYSGHVEKGNPKAIPANLTS